MTVENVEIVEEIVYVNEKDNVDEGTSSGGFGSRTEKVIIISPNEVFGDIMVLASPPPPRPPVDPDDVSALTRKNI